jgi:hypothetical protein
MLTMKRVCRLIFLGSLSIALAVIFIAGCSSKSDAKSTSNKGKKDRTSISEATSLQGRIA